MEPSVADGWAKSVSENEAVTRHEPLKKKTQQRKSYNLVNEDD